LVAPSFAAGHDEPPRVAAECEEAHRALGPERRRQQPTVDGIEDQQSAAVVARHDAPPGAPQARAHHDPRARR
jgi:hypothetical protein